MYSISQKSLATCGFSHDILWENACFIETRQKGSNFNCTEMKKIPFCRENPKFLEYIIFFFNLTCKIKIPVKFQRARKKSLSTLCFSRKTPAKSGRL